MARRAASYTLLDGSTPRPASAKLPDQSPPSPQEDLGGPRPRPAQQKSEDWGNERARRAHNLPSIPARMSARSRRKIFQTYPCGEGRPGPDRRKAGLGCGKPVLARGAVARSRRSVSSSTRPVLSRGRQSMRGGYARLGVTRHRAETARGGRGRGGKDDLCEIIALSPFGRL